MKKKEIEIYNMYLALYMQPKPLLFLPYVRPMPFAWLCLQ
jgi:hypothetical protein